MFEHFGCFADGLISFLNPMATFLILWSTLRGGVIGILPGLAAATGIALATTLTDKPPAEPAILICVYAGAIYGGSRTAILLDIPGTQANAGATLDGFPLAKQGVAGRAMGVATSGSAIGTLIDMLLLATLAPMPGNHAVKVQSYEFAWPAVFRIAISGQMTALEYPLKGWIPGVGEDIGARMS